MLAPSLFRDMTCQSLWVTYAAGEMHRPARATGACAQRALADQWLFMNAHQTGRSEVCLTSATGHKRR